MSSAPLHYPESHSAPQVVPRRAFVAGAAIALASSLTGCAIPRQTIATDQPHWSGRLALQVEGSKPQSFAALFELEGSETQGQLSLFSPLGTTLGQLTWAAGEATLKTGQQVQQSGSLEDLVMQLTGSALPIKAIFNWLKGIPSDTPGWTSDLTAVSEGRISARRISPAPEATLRIALAH